MALVTFSSPMQKDKTVYAVAGSHKQTILQLAKENHIPIDFGCENGECGTCIVEVTPVDKKLGHKDPRCDERHGQRDPNDRQDDRQDQ